MRRTPPCVWCVWAAPLRRLINRCFKVEQQVAEHQMLKSLLATEFHGVIVLRVGWWLAVTHVEAPSSFVVRAICLRRHRAMYQRARWATELGFEKSIFDCRQPE